MRLALKPLGTTRLVSSLRSTIALAIAIACLFWIGRPSHGANPVRTGAPASNGNGCIACHRIDQGFSHPVDVVPSSTISIPDSLPLTIEGKITCTTCHDAAANHGAGTSGARRNYMLRATLTDAFGTTCAVCHRATAPTRQRGVRVSHALASERAHYFKSSKPGSRSVVYAYTQANTGLDTDSRNCLSCHDGTIARDVGREEHEGHPVGIAYRNSSPDREMQVRPVQMLDSRIMLFDGRIGCNSCHNPYSTEKSRLIMSNQGSRLCLSCHRG